MNVILMGITFQNMLINPKKNSKTKRKQKTHTEQPIRNYFRDIEKIWWCMRVSVSSEFIRASPAFLLFTQLKKALFIRGEKNYL